MYEPRHWNTIVLDGSIPDDELEELIEHSYALIVESLPQRVRSALQRRRRRSLNLRWHTR
jgi:predicted DNA-binding protein (MmcQ/YjbR family)